VYCASTGLCNPSGLLRLSAQSRATPEVEVVQCNINPSPSLQASRTSTKHLVDVLNGREPRLLDLQLHKELGQDGRTELAAKIDAKCISRLSPDLLRALSRLDMSWIPEKLRPNNSSWLSQLPLYEKGFALKAIKFRDGLALRYGYDAPVFCSCDDTTPFTKAHAFSCLRGGHIIARYNRVKKAFGNISAAAFPNAPMRSCVNRG
jgi:hypothetical protein